MLDGSSLQASPSPGAIFAIAQIPSADEFWVDTLVVSLVLGTIHIVSGWALLRRNPLARRLLLLSAFLLMVLDFNPFRYAYVFGLAGGAIVSTLALLAVTASI